MNNHQSISSKLILYKRSFKSFVLFVAICLGGCASPSSNITPTSVVSTETPAFTATAAPTMTPGDSEHIVSVGGRDRSYVLHIPPGLAESAPVPVVIVLHETTYSISQMRSTTKFDDLSNQNGVVLVYPKGLGTSWNGGGCCGIAMQDNVDDVEFVRQVLTELGKMMVVDPSRIYAAGFSNGGMMAYRLACELSSTFAAIASVEGPLFYEECQPENAVAILHIHGLSDPVVPFAGGESVESAVPMMLPPAEPGIKRWTQWNACSDLPDVNTSGAITHTVYSGCKLDTAVELYTIEGLQHSWPAPSGAGELSFPATQTIWDFFVAHAKQ